MLLQQSRAIAADAAAKCVHFVRARPTAIAVIAEEQEEEFHGTYMQRVPMYGVPPRGDSNTCHSWLTGWLVAL